MLLIESDLEVSCGGKGTNKKNNFNNYNRSALGRKPIKSSRCPYGNPWE